MDCSPPGSSVHGISKARILEWIAISSPGDLLDPGMEPRSPVLQADSLLSEPQGSPTWLPRIKQSPVLCNGHSKHPLPTTQEKTLHMDITRWPHHNQIDYILCSQRWRSSIQSAKTRPGADCGSDHELFIAKLRLKLKKVGKTTRPFRYDLNQIPYDYTVEMRNRFKGLDLKDRVPDELWTGIWDIQQTGIKTIPKEKKCKNAKWLSEEALQIAVKRREAKSKGEKKDISIWMQISKE